MVTEKEKPRGILNEDLMELSEGLEKIGKRDFKNPKLNYALEYNIGKAKRGVRAYLKSLNALREVYVKQDADGELMTIQTGVDSRGVPVYKYKFKTPELKKKFKEEADILDATPFDIKMFKIKVSTLQAEKTVNINASMMAQIGCILDRDIKIHPGDTV